MWEAQNKRACVTSSARLNCLKQLDSTLIIRSSLHAGFKLPRIFSVMSEKFKNCKIMFNKLAICALFLFAGAVDGLFEQSVGVRGRVVCGNQPIVNARVLLVDKDSSRFIQSINQSINRKINQSINDHISIEVDDHRILDLVNFLKALEKIGPSFTENSSSEKNR